jgi:hypothetical protein
LHGSKPASAIDVPASSITSTQWWFRFGWPCVQVSSSPPKNTVLVPPVASLPEPSTSSARTRGL